MASILVIDDEAEVLDSICEILQGGGYKTLKAENGEKGFEMAIQYKPDLIICDVRMPQGDEGFEVLAKLRQEPTTSKIPFIFLTLRDQGKDIVRGLELGAQDYVSKNSEIQEILARVKTHLELKTARKDLEFTNEELNKKNRELEHLNRLLEETTQVLKGYDSLASEKLRDKLTVINGHVKLLKDKYKWVADTFERLQTIDRCCDEILEAGEKFLER